MSCPDLAHDALHRAADALNSAAAHLTIASVLTNGATATDAGVLADAVEAELAAVYTVLMRL